MYQVIDHGEWERYTPDNSGAPAVPGLPPTLFCRRIGDGVDWYAYRNTDGTFIEGSVLATVLRDPANGVWTVKAVFRDETMIVPANHRVIEVLGIPEDATDPHNYLAWMTYDPGTKTLSGEPKPPVPEIVVAASQAKIQLSRMKVGDTNLYAKTSDLVAQSNNIELQIWWAEAKTWRPSNTNVQKIGAAFGLSQDDIKAAFDAASKIEE
jgi:hypothetical protein